MGGREYEIEPVGIADDLFDTDGTAILDYWQAQTKVRERMVERTNAAAGKTEPLTVADVTADYLEFLETSENQHARARYCTNGLILPKLGSIEGSKLTTEQISKWHTDLAKAPARVRTSPGDKRKYKQLGKDDQSPSGAGRLPRIGRLRS